MRWFQSYLSNRKQYVALGEVKSPEQANITPFFFTFASSEFIKCSSDFKSLAEAKTLVSSAKILKHNFSEQFGKSLMYIKKKRGPNVLKTNFMIIKSARKRDMEISLNISNSDGSSHALERKQCIKYLEVLIDESSTWKYHIAFVCSRISRNIGIISKLRYYLSIQQLKQICYNLIYS